MLFRLPRHLAVMTASVYTTQYLGVAFIFAAAVVVLREAGVGLDKLALIHLIGLPIAGKIFYAPFIDRYRLPFQGQYRSWLLLAQGLMTIILFIVGLLDFHTQLLPIFAILMGYTFIVALQDVAIDGLVCKIFDKSQRKYANSLQFSSNLLGNIIGGGVLLITYPYLGWQGSLWVLAGLTAISWLQLVFYNEPEQTTVPLTFKRLFGDCKHFIMHNKRWFVWLVIYPLGSVGAFTVLTPMLVDAGWDKSSIGFAVKIYGSIIGVCSALSAALIIKKIGRYRCLRYLTFALAISPILMLLTALGITHKLYVYVVITAYFIVFPAVLATFATLMMDKASAYPQCRATLFTLQFSLQSLLSFVYAGLFMALAKFVGYEFVIVLGIVCTFFCAIVSPWYLRE